MLFFSACVYTLASGLCPSERGVRGEYASWFTLLAHFRFHHSQSIRIHLIKQSLLLWLSLCTVFFLRCYDYFQFAFVQQNGGFRAAMFEPQAGV